MRIAVYAIAKNEEHFVARFCESAASADLIVIGDTGSTDGTAERARQAGATVHDITVSPWRFDKARDAVLSLVPRQIDVCISVDLDEILADGWREEIEALWELGQTTRMSYGFDWGKGVRFHADKIHSRHGYHWHHPCHEALRADPRIVEQRVRTEKTLVWHLPDDTKSRGQYLGLLEVGVKEDPYCSRNAIYYGRELTFAGLWRQAREELLRYLSLESASWLPERAYVMRLIGDSYEAESRFAEALFWYTKGTEEAPDWREPWYHLASAYYRRERWALCAKFAERCLKVSERPSSHLSEPDVWTYGPHDLLAISCYNLGRYHEAAAHGHTALSLAPNNKRLSENCRMYVASVSDLAE